MDIISFFYNANYHDHKNCNETTDNKANNNVRSSESAKESILEIAKIKKTKIAKIELINWIKEIGYFESSIREK